jgi:hypothetical protein
MFKGSAGRDMPTLNRRVAAHSLWHVGNHETLWDIRSDNLCHGGFKLLNGIFELQSADQLYGKLKRDYESLLAFPTDSGLAFNFVVTAWHLTEWKFAKPLDRTSFCEKNPVLRVCEHLAIGAKHFSPDPRRHDSVSSTSRGGVWSRGGLAMGSWANGSWAEWLVIELDGEAQRALGDQLRLDVFATLVMKAWEPVFRADAQSGDESSD